jgi:hypothetical protein
LSGTTNDLNATFAYSPSPQIASTTRSGSLALTEQQCLLQLEADFFNNIHPLQTLAVPDIIWLMVGRVAKR